MMSIASALWPLYQPMNQGEDDMASIGLTSSMNLEWLSAMWQKPHTRPCTLLTRYYFVGAHLITGQTSLYPTMAFQVISTKLPFPELSLSIWRTRPTHSDGIDSNFILDASLSISAIQILLVVYTVAIDFSSCLHNPACSAKNRKFNAAIVFHSLPK